ncbi:hypothetical protein B9Z55_010343 [Caenorhabditis nigoni]|uniref:SCP domain-containing protein n=1 Tax=Caenorhabditis nigoni TaxID=1611254 RepID=A0A2G5UFF4_9PELO|nr:hypothetical protein B9Z55_010343 [Caenorhabditis nigoni]
MLYSEILKICVLLVNGDLLTADQKASCLSKYNKIRSDYAKKNNVANMNRLVLDNELESLADAELEKADCNAIVMKNPKFEAIRDVEHSGNVSSFMTDPGRTQFACINKQCATTNDPWILVTNVPSETAKSGKPGSGCGSGRIPFEDGLCYVPETTQKPNEPSVTAELEESVSSSISFLAVSVLVVLAI